MASSPEINGFNARWRSSPQYQEILRSVGADPNRPLTLTDRQRKQVQAAIEKGAGFQFPSGVEIDPAGNMNENEGFAKQARRWGPMLAAGAVTMFGIPGTPIAGLFGGGAAGAASGASGSLGGLYTAPTAGVSQGVSTMAQGSGWLSHLLGLGKKGLDVFGANWRDAAGLGADVLSGMGDDAAANRGAKFEGQTGLENARVNREYLETVRDRDYFDQGIRREEEGRAGSTDAWQKLMRAQRVLNPPQRPHLTPYSAPPRQATDAERAGAEALTAEVMQRLQGGNPTQTPTRRDPVGPATMDPGLLDPGGMERTSNWLSPILGYLGRDRNAPQGQMTRQGGPINNPAGNASMPMPAPRGIRGITTPNRDWLATLDPRIRESIRF